MIVELAMIGKIALVSVWIGGSIGFYYFKYGRKGKIEIMSVSSIERKYKRINEENRNSIF